MDRTRPAEKYHHASVSAPQPPACRQWPGSLRCPPVSTDHDDRDHEVWPSRTLLSGVVASSTNTIIIRASAAPSLPPPARSPSPCRGTSSLQSKGARPPHRACRCGKIVFRDRDGNEPRLVAVLA